LKPFLLSESSSLTRGEEVTQFDQPLMALRMEAMQFNAPKIWTDDFWSEFREVEEGVKIWKMKPFVDGNEIDVIQEVVDKTRRKFEEIVRSYKGQLTIGSESD
jgi:hypothetical protein